MRNQKPIFLLGFQRGGTNIMLNMLRSHPEICSAVGETHEVFRGKGQKNNRLVSFLRRTPRLICYLPIVILQREIPFHDRNWNSRRSMPKWMQHYVDMWFAQDRHRATGETQNHYIREGEKYTWEQIENSRLMSKSTNGDIFATDILNDIYPDATFIALVRNGYAVIEGHMRRKHSLEKAATWYHLGVQKILHDAKKVPNYHIFHFENVLKNPIQQLHLLYEVCDLSIESITKVRMIPKPIVTATGEIAYMHDSHHEKIIWIDIQELPNFLNSNVNTNQINRLSAKDKARINAIAGESIQALGYEIIV